MGGVFEAVDSVAAVVGARQRHASGPPAREVAP